MSDEIAPDVRFPWDVLRAIIGGTSAIDVPRLTLKTREEAREFLCCYGFDATKPAHREELSALHADAIEFINDELLNGLELKIPKRIRSNSDIEKLLLAASVKVEVDLQKWSCAILRVMHTLSHSHSHFNEYYGDEIRRQILARFEPHLHMKETGMELGRDPGIPLVSFDVKPVKPRHSVAMKLLHKVENVAADVFDRVGVRFVTRERLDAVLAVRYLREMNVIMFANIKPSRSRNSLIDIDWLSHQVDLLEKRVAAGELTRADEYEELRHIVAERDFPSGPAPSPNPYSAVSYHSIQFTCRQMIRVPGPDGRDVRFFFPFEVQILDEESYTQSREGLAAHDLYKERQREAVRRRVLGDLLPD